jgi:hypothetical protein
MIERFFVGLQLGIALDLGLVSCTRQGELINQGF